VENGTVYKIEVKEVTDWLEILPDLKNICMNHPKDICSREKIKYYRVNNEV